MGYHFSPTPRVSARLGLVLAIGVAAFSVGLAGGFISGMRSERMEHEREVQRSKYAVERAGRQQRELERRIAELESQLSAAKEDPEKWQGLKIGDSVQNSGK